MNHIEKGAVILLPLGNEIWGQILDHRGDNGQIFSIQGFPCDYENEASSQRRFYINLCVVLSWLRIEHRWGPGLDSQEE